MENPNEIKLVFADDHLLVINKPAGLLSLPDGYDPRLPSVRPLLEPAWGPLWVVHRLDKDTSGIFLLARSADAHRHLSQQFENHQVRKIYHALVLGVPAWDQIESRAPLRAGVGRRKRTVIDSRGGKPAQTFFRIQRRFASAALIQAEPRTGRTHQIRAHLYGLGYPVLSDPLYGDQTISTAISRLALHAFCLELFHPANGERLSLEAVYPSDFTQALRILDQPTK
jgi:tRNA pseudouridine32 synthase / 23S rRNA pseudouridine746 synthase